MYPHISHQTDKPILEARAATARYGARIALDSVSFALRAGERVAVAGPNGAGKSTLLKVVAGVQPLSSGEVSVSGSRPSAHSCIAYVPQRSQVDWRFPVSVADVVMMGRSAKLGPFNFPKKRDWEIVARALDMVDLGGLAARQIGQLSGGQQQRAFIARALAQEAELMLMDEPFTGLDAPAQEGLLNLLETLRAQNVTVIVATHDLEQAAARFDRIMLLNKKIIAFDSAEKVLTADNLLAAYGGRYKAIDDSCCE